MRIFSSLFLLGFLFLILHGCQTSKTSPPVKADLPNGLSLGLWANKGSNQYLNYEIKPSGELRFGGGRMAVYRKTEPAGSITKSQFDEIRAIITSHNLFNAPSVGLFEKSGKVIHELSLNMDGKKHRIKCFDNSNHGVVELERYLSEIRSKRTGDEVYKTIEKKLNRNER